MVEASCHCGAVRISVSTPPTEVTSCNCSICRRLGSLWAYYDPADVEIIGDTAQYIWGDRMLALHHCQTCGCTTHWTPIGETRTDRMGVDTCYCAPRVRGRGLLRRTLFEAKRWTCTSVWSPA
jgi:hypothetical protein